MKLVIKIGSTGLSNNVVLAHFAEAVGQLLLQGHQVTVIHGGEREFLKNHSCSSNPSMQKSVYKEDMSLMVLGGYVNKNLVTVFTKNGVHAVGLCGADAGLIRVRLSPGTESANGKRVRVVSVDPLWLNIISQNCGVPIIANITPAPDGCHQIVCSDQLAAECSISWQANALIFLTGADGVRDSTGGVARWLDVGQSNTLIANSAGSRQILNKLVACRRALHAGVTRARMLPVTQVQALSTFYMERIDHGTEVILSCRAANSHTAPLFIPF